MLEITFLTILRAWFKFKGVPQSLKALKVSRKNRFFQHGLATEQPLLHLATVSHQNQRRSRTFAAVDGASDDRAMAGSGIVQPVAELTLTAQLNPFRLNTPIEQCAGPRRHGETQGKLDRFGLVILRKHHVHPLIHFSLSLTLFA